MVVQRLVTQGVPAGWLKWQRHTTTILAHGRYLPDRSSDFDWNRLFEPDPSAVERIASGRGTARFIRIGEQQGVLRHYRRGGWIGRWIEECYLWSGLERSRPLQELRLTAKLEEAGLPVAPVVAVRVQRSGLCYRGDLLTVALTESEPLLDRLHHTPLTAEEWMAIGATLARFHRYGLDHADLNGRNILLAPTLTATAGIWLIDFDRCRHRRPAPAWQQANLQRLYRSLQKEQRLRPPLSAWNSRAWQALQAGYAATEAA